ncbi:MAG: hypothetical protein MI861_25005, partial [Pirellulales bacterium]|nr:hypothetical protein [Pirellulales bacterium]
MNDQPEMREAATGTKVIEPVAALVKLVVSGKCAIPGVGLWERWQITLPGGTAYILLLRGDLSTTIQAKRRFFLLSGPHADAPFLTPTPRLTLQSRNFWQHFDG